MKQLLEALPLQKAKELTLLWKKAGMDKNLEDWFKGKHRLYYPLYGFEDKDVVEIYKVCMDEGFTILSFDDGIAYKNGDTKRQFKVGKILAKANRQDLLNAYSKSVTSIKEKKNSKQTSGNEDLFVVISRHAYDIGGMSTDRDWDSCMNLIDGANKHYVPIEIKVGSIIAYLIKSSDMNINKPLSRILIKPYKNQSNENDILMYPSTTKGLQIKEFNDFVMNWLDVKQETKKGIYKMHCDVYQEGKSTVNKNGELIDFITDWKYDKNTNTITSSGYINLENMNLKTLNFKFPI